MKLPTIQNAKRYTGLYVVDFGDHSGVGFTALEVAELLESELFAAVKVYKIHNAYPDGRMELKGVRNETFQLEAGMLFYAADEQTARKEYKQLTAVAVASAPPARAKVYLARLSESEFITALIYPAEHDDDFSRWLLDNKYRTAGTAEGGSGVIARYYDMQKEILDQQQLWAADSFDQLTGQELLAATKKAVVR
jgi:hypothetical protein